MKIKTSEATGAVLDWLVAKCEGTTHLFDAHDVGRLNYSTDQALGGPIIESMLAAGLLLQARPETNRWAASVDTPNRFHHGPTALVAAMRCFVTSKLGTEVEVPDELI